MSVSPISPMLASRVQSAPAASLLRVVIELKNVDRFVSELPRTSRIVEAKRQLSANLDTVAHGIQSLGGEVLGSAWLNRTILADVPASTIQEIAMMDRVQSVDVPSSLSIESV